MKKVYNIKYSIKTHYFNNINYNLYELVITNIVEYYNIMCISCMIKYLKNKYQLHNHIMLYLQTLQI